jgi:hypothetical protein
VSSFQKNPDVMVLRYIVWMHPDQHFKWYLLVIEWMWHRVFFHPMRSFSQHLILLNYAHAFSSFTMFVLYTALRFPLWCNKCSIYYCPTFSITLYSRSPHDSFAFPLTIWF